MKRREKIGLLDLRSEIEKTRNEMIRATTECKGSVDALSGRVDALVKNTENLTAFLQGTPDSPGLLTVVGKIERDLKHVWWIWSVLGVISITLLAEIIGWFRPG